MQHGSPELPLTSRSCIEVGRFVLSTFIALESRATFWCCWKKMCLFWMRQAERSSGRVVLRTESLQSAALDRSPEHDRYQPRWHALNEGARQILIGDFSL